MTTEIIEQEGVIEEVHEIDPTVIYIPVVHGRGYWAVGGFFHRKQEAIDYAITTGTSYSELTPVPPDKIILVKAKLPVGLK